jgi:hypothetical protein
MPSSVAEKSTIIFRLIFAYTLFMGGERGSTARARLAGEICCWCKKRLGPPEHPGERSCEDCCPAHAPRRHVYMYFMKRQGWYCQFLEADLKTSLPRKLNLDDPEKLIEMAQRRRVTEPRSGSDAEVRDRNGTRRSVVEPDGGAVWEAQGEVIFQHMRTIRQARGYATCRRDRGLMPGKRFFPGTGIH